MSGGNRPELGPLHGVYTSHRIQQDLTPWGHQRMYLGLVAAIEEAIEDGSMTRAKLKSATCKTVMHLAIYFFILLHQSWLANHHTAR